MHIDNIPEDTMYLFVSLYDITVNDRLYTGTSFKNNKLDEVMKNGFVNCPFVKNGHEYEIIVSADILTEENIKSIASASITTTANCGIQIINNPTLIWSNKDNIATLSERPVFSDEGINLQNTELGYGLVFLVEETNGGISGSVSAGLDELTCELTYDNTQYFYSLIEMIGNMGLRGNIPIFANVKLTLEYEETEWTLLFAKSESIIYSLTEL